jgi:hypothetical protein
MDEPFRKATGVSAGADVAGALLLPRPGRPPRLVSVDRDLLLGRDDRCDVVLPSSRVSRRHAHIWPYGGGVAVEDLKSRNGTRVNGRQVTSISQLQDGDTLTLGDVQLQFRLLGDGAVSPVSLQPVPPDAYVYQVAGERVDPIQPPAAEGGRSGAAKPLALAVLESLVGTAFSQAIGTDLAGTYALAVITPLLGTVFALRSDGKIRLGAVVLMTAIAVAVTIVGVTAADTALGRSVFPWSKTERTFIPPPDTGSKDATKLIMPKLVGESNVTAMQLLIRYGFNPQLVLVVDTPSSQQLFGKVVRTDPVAGAKVPNDAIVRIFIGTGTSP